MSDDLESVERIIGCMPAETPASMMLAHSAIRQARMNAELTRLRALVEKRERQIAKLERLCVVGEAHLLFAPSGVGCWEVDGENGERWLEADTFYGLLEAIDEACP